MPVLVSGILAISLWELLSEHILKPQKAMIFVPSVQDDLVSK